MVLTRGLPDHRIAVDHPSPRFGVRELAGLEQLMYEHCLKIAKLASASRPHHLETTGGNIIRELTEKKIDRRSDVVLYYNYYDRAPMHTLMLWLKYPSASSRGAIVFSEPKRPRLSAVFVTIAFYDISL